MIRFRISGYVFRISEPVVLERVEILSLIEQFQFNFLDDNRWQFILSGLKNTIIITFLLYFLVFFWDLSLLLSVLHMIRQVSLRSLM
ncbi:hypothetical protein CK1_22880 [Ruminococcus sp. SR1/5]|nr:hypothetical protein CK1_22880 [Ruminococcus sp. SR1/5]